MRRGEDRWSMWLAVLRQLSLSVPCFSGERTNLMKRLRRLGTCRHKNLIAYKQDLQVTSRGRLERQEFRSFCGSKTRESSYQIGGNSLPSDFLRPCFPFVCWEVVLLWLTGAAVHSSPLTGVSSELKSQAHIQFITMLFITFWCFILNYL